MDKEDSERKLLIMYYSPSFRKTVLNISTEIQPQTAIGKYLTIECIH